MATNKNKKILAKKKPVKVVTKKNVKKAVAKVVKKPFFVHGSVQG